MTTETIKIVRTDLNGNFLSNNVRPDIILKLSIAIAKATTEQALYMCQAVYCDKATGNFYKIVKEH